MSNRQDLARVIKATAVYFNRQMEPEVLSMMCDDLADLDPAKCIAGYSQYRRNPANKTFPLPAQIRELVNPDEFVAIEARARMIASRIVGAVTKFGWNNPGRAKEFIGPEGWQAVEIQGGWMNLCENLGSRLPATTFQAQMRDQVDGLLRHGSAGMEKSIGAASITRIRSGDLSAVGDITKLIGRGDPDGAA